MVDFPNGESLQDNYNTPAWGPPGNGNRPFPANYESGIPAC